MDGGLRRGKMGKNDRNDRHINMSRYIWRVRSRMPKGNTFERRAQCEEPDAEWRTRGAPRERGRNRTTAPRIYWFAFVDLMWNKLERKFSVHNCLQGFRFRCFSFAKHPLHSHFIIPLLYCAFNKISIICKTDRQTATEAQVANGIELNSPRKLKTLKK